MCFKDEAFDAILAKKKESWKRNAMWPNVSSIKLHNIKDKKTTCLMCIEVYMVSQPGDVFRWFNEGKHSQGLCITTLRSHSHTNESYQFCRLQMLQRLHEIKQRLFNKGRYEGITIDQYRPIILHTHTHCLWRTLPLPTHFRMMWLRNRAHFSPCCWFCIMSY